MSKSSRLKYIFVPFSPVIIWLIRVSKSKNCFSMTRIFSNGLVGLNSAISFLQLNIEIETKKYNRILFLYYTDIG